MAEEHLIPVTRTARYLTFGDPISPSTRIIWIACHGYGQQVGRFIQKFNDLSPAQHRVIAPEGLSRFYWSRNPDQVGASWMTREKRLLEIEDYCNFLDQIYDLEVRPHLDRPLQINFLGFSQGCATICRWMHARQPIFHRLILWAGQTPEDISYLHLKDYLEAKDQWMIYGEKDQFITPERIAWQLKFAQEQGFQLQVRTFEGPHVIDRKALSKLVELWTWVV